MRSWARLVRAGPVSGHYHPAAATASRSPQEHSQALGGCTLPRGSDAAVGVSQDLEPQPLPFPAAGAQDLAAGLIWG